VNPYGRNLEGVPFPQNVKDDMLAWHRGPGESALWKYKYPGDEISRQIDTMTLEDYYMRVFGISREAVRILYTGDTTSGLGLGPDALSGFCAYAWTSIPTTDDSMATGLQMFPGGNSGMNRLIVKTLIPEAFDGPHSMEAVWKNPLNFSALDRPGQATRLRLRSTVVRVEHEGDPVKAEFVRVTYAGTQNGKIYRVRAKTAIMAGGGWITKRVVRDLDKERRAAYDTFCYSPYLVANVAIRNWRFLYKLGISGGEWFEGLGRFVDVRKMALFGVDSPVAGPDLPTVLTLFIDFSNPNLSPVDQGHAGRAELLSTPYAEYERRIREQFMEMFGASGFDAKGDIAGIILNRWGHAFINPQPGFFFGKAGENGAPRDALRKGPFGRIAFSHSDLAGAMDHRNAFMESHRAVGQLLDAVYS
jgi:spermidine dehydrogenase